MMLYLCTQLYQMRLQTRHLSRQHPSLSLDPVKSRCHRPVDCCHKSRLPQTIDVAQEPQVSSCCKENAPRPVSMLLICQLAHVLCTMFFSNPSSFQSSQLLVFCSRDLLATTALLLGSPCLGPDTETGKVLAPPAWANTIYSASSF